MCRTAATLVLIVGVLGVVTPISANGVLYEAARTALQNEIKNLQATDLGTETYLSRNPTTLTTCVGKNKHPGDSKDFTDFINGCVGKAVVPLTLDTNLKTVLVRFANEGFKASNTEQRLSRITTIIACALALALGK